MGQTTSCMGEEEQGWLTFPKFLPIKVPLVLTSAVKVDIKKSRGAFAKRWPIAAGAVSTYREMEASAGYVTLVNWNLSLALHGLILSGVGFGDSIAEIPLWFCCQHISKSGLHAHGGCGKASHGTDVPNSGKFRTFGGV